MTRKALFMIAAAALLLASAFAVFCAFGNDSSTADNGPAFAFGDPQAPGPDRMGMQMQDRPEPPDMRAPGQPRYVIDAPRRDDWTAFFRRKSCTSGFGGHKKSSKE